jgi:aromatic ring hydroxylase
VTYSLDSKMFGKAIAKNYDTNPNEKSDKLINPISEEGEEVVSKYLKERKEFKSIKNQHDKIKGMSAHYPF